MDGLQIWIPLLRIRAKPPVLLSFCNFELFRKHLSRFLGHLAALSGSTSQIVHYQEVSGSQQTAAWTP
jgi:hypothetical protein